MRSYLLTIIFFSSSSFAHEVRESNVRYCYRHKISATIGIGYLSDIRWDTFCEQTEKCFALCRTVMVMPTLPPLLVDVWARALSWVIPPPRGLIAFL